MSKALDIPFIDTENVSDKTFFCSLENIDLLEFLIEMQMSWEAEVSSVFEMAGSSVTKSICLRLGRHVHKSNLSLRRQIPVFRKTPLKRHVFILVWSRIIFCWLNSLLWLPGSRAESAPCRKTEATRCLSSSMLCMFDVQQVFSEVANMQLEESWAATLCGAQECHIAQ